jgi:hypothetical protein
LAEETSCSSGAFDSRRAWLLKDSGRIKETVVLCGILDAWDGQNDRRTESSPQEFFFMILSCPDSVFSVSPNETVPAASSFRPSRFLKDSGRIKEAVFLAGIIEARHRQNDRGTESSPLEFFFMILSCPDSVFSVSPNETVPAASSFRPSRFLKDSGQTGEA